MISIKQSSNTTTSLEKIIVASGNKVAIGNSLQEAIKNLLSQSAVDIEVIDSEDEAGMIQAIINANKNLRIIISINFFWAI